MVGTSTIWSSRAGAERYRVRETGLSAVGCGGERYPIGATPVFRLGYERTSKREVISACRVSRSAMEERASKPHTLTIKRQNRFRFLECIGMISGAC